jgi:hypothetical protein
METLQITVVLTETEAWEFAQFLKRACFSDYRNHATSEAEAYHMIDAGEQIRRALAEQGLRASVESAVNPKRPVPAGLPFSRAPSATISP